MAAPIPAELMEAWGSAGGSSGDLALPQRNEYIATDFSLREAPEEAKSASRTVSRTTSRTTSSRSVNGSVQVHAYPTPFLPHTKPKLVAGVRATAEGVATASTAAPPVAALRCSRLAPMWRLHKPHLI